MTNGAARHRAGSLHIFTARRRPLLEGILYKWEMLQSPVKNWFATCPHSRSHRPPNEFMKHRETMMKINALSSRPMSACLRLFIQSLLAEHYAEIAIVECLADDAIVGNAFAPSASLGGDYHLLLDEQAEQIFSMTDDIAERARKLGRSTLRSISDIANRQRLKDNNEAAVARSEAQVAADRSRTLAASGVAQEATSDSDCKAQVQ